MLGLPVVPRFKRYRGAKPNLQRKSAEEFRVAQRIAEHVNTEIANNPAELQQILFGFVAIELGVTTEQVRSALPGGYNGFIGRLPK